MDHPATSHHADSRVHEAGALKRPFAPVALVLSLVLTYAAAGIGGAATTPQIEGWYRTIEKPFFTPPDWLFGPVWGVLYTMMAVVLWQIWRTPAVDTAMKRLRSLALVAFAVQLLLNVAWSVVFFGFQTPLGGLLVIVPLWASIVWTMVAARPVIGWVVWLFVPYLLWVGFAAVLNAAIVALNT